MLYDLFDPEAKITVKKITHKKESQKTIKLTSMDLDDDNLIDEDDLLSSYNELMSGLTIPIPKSDKISKKDCQISRKACINCTCGRADGSLEPESKPSACGNCYLGDGFRCDSCPSKGLPPFDPDEN